MSVSSPWSKFARFWILFLATCANLAAAELPKATSCAAPEHRQFDFWVGDWDAFDVDSANKIAPNKSAHVRVESILDGCVLREEYEGADGLKGQSFSIYDASRRVWHQSWLTNRGQLLVIEGKFSGGEIVLSGVERKSGVKVIVRGTWKPVSGGVRETAVTSSDGGRTWKPWFDILFRRHEP